MDEDRLNGEDQRGAALRAGQGAPGCDEPAAAPEPESLPRSVRSRLDNCATDWLRAVDGLPPRASRTGWVVAVALLVLAVLGWWPRASSWVPGDGASRVAQLSAELSRERLLAAGGRDLRHWAWSTGEGGFGGVTGDVVWDAARDEGYLQFIGLEPNVPARHQYQLWIVDASRDQRYPVDGGVFDVPRSDGPVVIPVRARIPVREPAAFVVTVEKPGGTVVSTRERVVAVATPPSH